MKRTRGTVAVVGAREELALVERAVGEVFHVVTAELDAVPDVVALVVVAEELAAALLAGLPDAAAIRIAVLGRAAPDDPRIVHVVPRELPAAALRPLLLSLAERRPVAAPPAAPPQSQAEARRVQRAFAASRNLAAAQDLGATERVIVDATAELTGADRVHCLFHDASDGSLWSESRRATVDGDERRALRGVVGFAAHTGAAVALERAGADPRYDAALDDPGGEPDSALLVQPVVGVDGQVHAVIVAARGARRPPFTEAEVGLLAAFARFAAPFLDQLSVHVEAQAVIESAAPEDDGLFRREALEAQALPRWGEVIRVSPSWVSWAYWVLLALLAAAIVYVSVGTVSTYSAGPAIVRSTTRADVVARTAGNVTEVLLGSGAAVEPGDLIARLDDADARGAVDRLEREFETQLRNHMIDPSDAAADAALRTLRLQLDEARVALEDRLIRAETGGVIADVRVRSGQRVEPGNIVASIVDGSGSLEVIALLPGSDRPQLAPGMRLRLELTGYRYAYQTVTIDSVSADVMAPTEARRVLGVDVESLRLPQSVVVVRARIPGREFEVDGDTFRYHDGMIGHAEVRVREEKIIYTLVPGLRKL